MPRGDQQVEMRIADLQDKGEVQVVTVKVCRCVGGQCVAPRSSAGMGAWGILALLLALAMLLLLCEFEGMTRVSLDNMDTTSSIATMRNKYEDFLYY